MRLRAHVVVSGLVQGVCFRYATEKEARGRGVAGWVRNLPDGRVEAVFEGEEEMVEEMIAFCRRGPPGARVDGVEVRREAPAGASGAFSIRY
ncbi:Acylphosphatase [Methanofollis liminatans DSM 4140]|uniref:Acylphosphatase n=1 Tax=Methanofollis liminatans DSM 4140 TaxID=28892 RepID=J1L0P3_9EURY|nr:acylphosphatase [Methanofollis liminatans]EJG06190.1 Acylphosphatase [Methanofollis liminatans DSM 4140]